MKRQVRFKDIRPKEIPSHARLYKKISNVVMDTKFVIELSV